MGRIGTSIAALAAWGLLGTSADGSTEPFAEIVARGDAGWAERDRGERDGRPAREPIRGAVEAYAAALAIQPDNLEARWKLLRALHFEAEFVVQDDSERRRLFDGATRISEEGMARLAGRYDGVDAAEDRARLHFWSAIAWGGWSRSAGLLGALREGVASRMRDAAQVTIELEPAYEEGGAFRLLGRLHAVLPRLPWLSGWVDRDRAIPLIERAYAIAPEHPGNRLLLALTLLDLAPARRGEALGILRALRDLTPRPAMRIEDLAMRREARQRLARETRREGEIDDRTT